MAPASGLVEGPHKLAASTGELLRKRFKLIPSLRRLGARNDGKNLRVQSSMGRIRTQKR
jgi:hypothetical protein